MNCAARGATPSACRKASPISPSIWARNKMTSYNALRGKIMAPMIAIGVALSCSVRLCIGKRVERAAY